MRLLTLALSHFKGIQEFEINPNGNNLAIYGDNATGKTTCADGYLWLLFDKDTEGKKDFDIKTLTKDGDPIHNLEHRVTGKWALDSGATLELEKTYREKWVKSRGKAKAEFDGHNTEYRINGVPVPKKDYDAKVASICDEQRFRLLSDPTYFCVGLKWQDRRRILLDLIGDITDANVIASNPALARLPAILGTHTLDDYRRMASASRKKTADALEQIPVRIDELSKSTAVTSAPVGLDRGALESEIQSLNERRAAIAAGAETSELRAAITQAEADRDKLWVELREELGAGRNAAKSHVMNVEQMLAGSKADLDRITTQAQMDRNAIADLDAELERLRGRYSQIAAEEFVFEGVDSCAACGQSLPSDRVEAARLKAEEAFNQAKSERLEANRADGKSRKNQRETVAAKLAAKEVELERLTAEVTRISEDLADARAHFDAMGPEADLSTHPRMVEAEDRIVKIGNQLLQARNGNSESLAKLDDSLAGARSKLTEIQRAEAAAAEAERAKVRIADLEEEEKRLAGEIERIDHELHLCEEFIRAKVRLLEERVNDRFQLVNFRLFEDQINGGLQETCKATVNGVPYESLNRGSRINAGLDIINTLAEAFEFAPPVILDNAESVTKHLPTKGQQIRLVVSEPDKVLRVVIEPAKQLALA